MGKRIVMVSKEDEHIDSLMELVKLDGHMFLGSSPNLEDSIGLIMENDPHVFVLDIQNNAETAVDTISQIRRFNPKVAIIVSYSKPLDEYFIGWCKEFKVDVFIQFPYERQIIQNALSLVQGADEEATMGDVICVGYTPSMLEKQVMKKLRMKYLYYPTCYLAAEFFESQDCGQFLILILNSKSHFYSNYTEDYRSQTSKIYRNNKAKEKNEPWLRVLKAAQLAYQNYWGVAIVEGLLPKWIPGLYIAPNSQFPSPIPVDAFQKLDIEPVSGENTFDEFQDSGLQNKPGMAFIEKAANIGKAIRAVAVKYPHLINPPTQEDDQNEFKKPLQKIQQNKPKPNITKAGTVRMTVQKR